MTKSNVLLKLENIGFAVGKQTILSGINLDLERGKITTLIGPNGGGKTSIARIILGIIKPTCGKVIKNSRIKVGYMPQKISVDHTIPLTANDFIHLSTKTIHGKNIKNLIERLDVNEILHRQIHDLSGGQLQKILFLRAIAGNPELLVLDEPTQCMDVAATQDFYRIIDEIRKVNECTILLISHDLHVVMQKTDFVLCINHHVCCHGSPESIHQHPEYLSLFGNKNLVAVYQHHHNHKH